MFDPRDSGYHTFRIPAIVARGGVLFAFCEGRRYGSGDAGEIDVVLRRSYDGGHSWGELAVLSSVPGRTCGNPTPVVDPGSGDLVLVTVQNGADTDEAAATRGTDPDTGRRVYVQRSRDGVGFSPPEEITAQVKPVGWGWYATGPCHAIALTHGRHPGRIVVPANHSRLPPPGVEPVRYSGGHCILSDDGGRTWRLGFVDDNDGPAINANETAVAELPDGRLYFTARNHRGTGPARVHAWSADGGEHLTAPYAGIAGITAPGVQGSVLAVGDRLLATTPADPRIRRELTVFGSDDGGASWRPELVLHAGMAGYSDLVALPDGRVGALYESGETSSFAALRFATFDPARC
ncbi:hypothetical protein Athai_33370 [Actinocatenispora thailandica]|uniref:exo-alpha-sialidase n=1 Tax=Actinocatenispora thailandica TaxID=227318 RepID=A0A7R7DQA8_9ACTN|nr:hypothetical protein Athai_33370 [Actinocatenispora thailandica]